jgi:hypothetical protein
MFKINRPFLLLLALVVSLALLIFINWFHPVTERKSAEMVLNESLYRKGTSASAPYNLKKSKEEKRKQRQRLLVADFCESRNNLFKEFGKDSSVKKTDSYWNDSQLITYKYDGAEFKVHYLPKEYRELDPVVCEATITKKEVPLPFGVKMGVKKSKIIGIFGSDYSEKNSEMRYSGDWESVGFTFHNDALSRVHMEIYCGE